jgi:sulfite exporter TauE/SafE
MKGIFSRGFGRLSGARSSVAYLPLGLLLGLLPCGPVYTGLVASARAGMTGQTALEGFLSGMVLMLAFGIGTLPSLLFIGKLASLGWLKSRESVYKIGSVLMILVGIYFVVNGIFY